MTDTREIVIARRIQRIKIAIAPHRGYILHLQSTLGHKALTRVVSANWVESYKATSQGYYIEYSDGSSGYLATLQSDLAPRIPETDEIKDVKRALSEAEMIDLMRRSAAGDYLEKEKNND